VRTIEHSNKARYDSCRVFLRAHSEIFETACGRFFADRKPQSKKRNWAFDTSSRRCYFWLSRRSTIHYFWLSRRSTIHWRWPILAGGVLGLLAECASIDLSISAGGQRSLMFAFGFVRHTLARQTLQLIAPLGACAFLLWRDGRFSPSHCAH
jgi:hypothetical protein